MNAGGGMDMQAVLQQAIQMQQQLMAAKQRLGEAKVEGTSGGGLVKVTMNGDGDVEDVTIDPGAIDTDDAAETAQTVADLVLAAIRDAESAVERLQEEEVGPLKDAMGGMPGMGGGIPGLPGM